MNLFEYIKQKNPQILLIDILKIYMRVLLKVQRNEIKQNYFNKNINNFIKHSINIGTKNLLINHKFIYN